MALYVVGTPIGNLEDITLRALRLLGEVELIAAEDTRTTRVLLSKYGVRTRLTSYHEHSTADKFNYLVGFMKEHSLAVVSDAGMPGLSDPGYKLISAAIESRVPVTPVPGASGIITALAASGLPANRFLFLGFPPRRSAQRQRLFSAVSDEPGSLVLYEAPHRLVATLEDARQALGDRRVAVSRELTKVHEEVFRGSLSQAIEHFAHPRGEFTLVIEGGRPERAGVDVETEQALKRLRRGGYSALEAVGELSQLTGIGRKKLYQRWLELAKEE